MNTIIEKIRAEVLRLIRESEGPGSQYGFGMMSACNRILKILDTLQEQPVSLPSQTKEEQEMQMARFLANKKETFFQLILANLIQNSAFVQMKEGINGDLSEFKAISVRAAIDAAIDGADYAITKLYPVEKKED